MTQQLETQAIEPRMTQPVLLIPEAYQHLQGFAKAAQGGDVPARTLELMNLRASQINCCGVCIEGHVRILKKMREADERLFAVAAWREAPYFTPAERAALALTEAVTRLSDRENPVPDAVWDEAARHYDERGLASLLIGIATINVFNRLNVATRQPTGAWKPE